MKIWLIYKVGMKFWIKMDPRHGHLCTKSAQKRQPLLFFLLNKQDGNLSYEASFIPVCLFIS